MEVHGTFFLHVLRFYEKLGKSSRQKLGFLFATTYAQLEFAFTFL